MHNVRAARQGTPCSQVRAERDISRDDFGRRWLSWRLIRWVQSRMGNNKDGIKTTWSTRSQSRGRVVPGFLSVPANFNISSATSRQGIARHFPSSRRVTSTVWINHKVAMAQKRKLGALKDVEQGDSVYKPPVGTKTFTSGPAVRDGLAPGARQGKSSTAQRMRLTTM